MKKSLIPRMNHKLKVLLFAVFFSLILLGGTASAVLTERQALKKGLEYGKEGELGEANTIVEFNATKYWHIRFELEGGFTDSGISSSGSIVIDANTGKPIGNEEIIRNVLTTGFYYWAFCSDDEIYATESYARDTELALKNDYAFIEELDGISQAETNEKVKEQEIKTLNLLKNFVTNFKEYRKVSELSTAICQEFREGKVTAASGSKLPQHTEKRIEKLGEIKKSAEEVADSYKLAAELVGRQDYNENFLYYASVHDDYASIFDELRGSLRSMSKQINSNIDFHTETALERAGYTEDQASDSEESDIGYAIIGLALILGIIFAIVAIVYFVTRRPKDPHVIKYLPKPPFKKHRK